MIIQINQMHVKIQDKEILKDISLQVKKGTFVGVIGPNGSGKSTMLRTIYRGIQPSAGAVYIQEKDVTKIRSKDLAKEMAVLKQENQGAYDFTVEEIVMMGRSPHKRFFEPDTVEDREIVKEALDAVGMYTFRLRRFNELSGGEKQRILIARALTQKPSILVLDEPTNHLDIHHQIQLLDLVKNFDLTVVAALHDLNLAARTCDELIVLEEGEVVAVGKPEEIVTEKLLEDVFKVKTMIQPHPINKLQITYIAACNNEKA
ncbi:ABC transporter ATP-binding protein [Cytobacillus spongiae]|uniref:ABC transporter ATP-binding protein n=1 Tax=Cytobacillus spongiae TaxID=2901381 RepID=UPI001F25A6A5|nr:ABC transporter ATP-binding protein [Cytobacillus spongiae]UII55493.1 ABC transporter ATP-binding protein [Cytobacillus spongiae]